MLPYVPCTGFIRLPVYYVVPGSVSTTSNTWVLYLGTLHPEPVRKTKIRKKKKRRKKKKEKRGKERRAIVSVDSLTLALSLAL